MKFEILTLFPEMFLGPLSESIIKRAQEKGIIEINYHNIRDFAEDKHKTVDDTPYGGGNGMVMKVDVIDKALQAVISSHPVIDSEVSDLIAQTRREPTGGWIEGGEKSSRIILLTPKGQKFNQEKAIELAKYDRLILICGHYEGFDERIREHLIDEEISIGDFVLTGGELPAMCIIDATARMIPGVLSEGSADEETFMRKNDKGQYVNEYPQYTRPLEYENWKVPDILLSGNHAEIKKWREKTAKKL